MKIKSEYILRNTAGTWIAMAVTPDNSEIDGVLTLNESGVMLWEALASGCEACDLVRILTKEYEIDVAQATEDVNDFINKLNRFGCLL